MSKKSKSNDPQVIIPLSEYERLVDRGEARQELLDLKEGMSKDAELGALVRKMPISSGLLHYRSVHGEDLWAYTTAVYGLTVDLMSVHPDPVDTLRFVLEPIEEEK